MSRSGFNRKTALATVTMVLAAEAADVDVVWSLKGSIAGLQHHRGITHSFVGVPFVAAAVLSFVWLLQRFRRKPLATSASPPLRWGYLYFCAFLAALSHLLLDYTTAYGIRLFEPFNYRWYSWDIVYIIEPLMLLALVAALTIPALLGLVSHEIGARSKLPRGRGAAIAALVFILLLYGYRDYQHRRALTALDSFTFHDAAPQRVAAYPYMINPFRWHGVVETRDFFETVPVDSAGPEVAFNEGIQFFKPPQTPPLEAADNSYFGHVYLDWAVFPYMRVTANPQDQPGYLVSFQDLRYTYPWARALVSTGATPHAPLGGYVLLSPDLHVLAEGMNSSRPASLKDPGDNTK
jgi:inner membrane protein